jgi:septal ring factor EnvC (AmiA/AmiB activator)
MLQLEDQIKRIQDKLQRLLKQQQVLSRENEELKEQLSVYKNESVDNRNTIDELKQQVSILKVNAAEMTDIDKREFEKRLNYYIKEIDRCIAMLSN